MPDKGNPENPLISKILIQTTAPKTATPAPAQPFYETTAKFPFATQPHRHPEQSPRATPSEAAAVILAVCHSEQSKESHPTPTPPRSPYKAPTREPHNSPESV